MILLYLSIFIWVILCVILTIAMFRETNNFPSKDYLTIKYKELWVILFQYVLLAPHMVACWLIVLMRCVPIKSKK